MYHVGIVRSASLIATVVLAIVQQHVHADQAQDQLRIAAEHYEQGRWRLAGQEFQQFLDHNPDHPRSGAARFFLAESLVQREQYAEARRHFRDSLASLPAHRYQRQAEFRIAQTAHFAGDGLAAAIALESFVAAYPDDSLCAFAIPYLAEIAEKRSDTRAASQLYRAALERFPDGPHTAECQMGVARLARTHGDSEQAIHYFESVAQSSNRLAGQAAVSLAQLHYEAADNAAALAALDGLKDKVVDDALEVDALYWRGRVRGSQSRWHDAEKAFRDAAEIAAGHSLEKTIAFARANALRHIGREEAAEQLLWELVDLDRDCEWADDSLRILVEMAFAKNDYPRVQELAQLFSQRFRDSTLIGYVRQAAARSHVREHEYDAALALLEEPTNAEQPVPMMDAILYELGWALIDAGRHSESAAVFAELASGHANSGYHADAVFRVAKDLQLRGEQSQAEQLLRQLPLSQCRPALRSHVLLTLGELAAQQAQWDRVAQPLLQLLKEFPDTELHRSARYWLAEASFRAGSLSEASEQFEQLRNELQLEQTDWAGAISLRTAQIRYRQGDWSGALELVLQFPAQYPDFARQHEADYLGGRCLVAAARFREARDAFQRVVRAPRGSGSETAAMAQWMIGESFFHQRHFAQAIAAYREVERFDGFPKWQAAALLQRGTCQELLGESAAAMALYKRVTSTFPDTLATQAARVRLDQLDPLRPAQPSDLSRTQ